VICGMGVLGWLRAKLSPTRNDRLKVTLYIDGDDEVRGIAIAIAIAICGSEVRLLRFKWFDEWIISNTIHDPVSGAEVKVMGKLYFANDYLDRVLGFLTFIEDYELEEVRI